MWETNPSEYLHWEPMLLLSWGGGGGGAGDTRVMRWQSKKWTNYSSLWWTPVTYLLHLIVAVTSERNCTWKKNEKCVCVCELSPSIALVNHSNPFFLPPRSWPADQSSKWWWWRPRPRARLTGRYALTIQNCFLIKWASTRCHQASNLWF